jgi:predicted phage tail protein
MSAANIFVAVLFSLVGFAAFRYGKKEGEARPMFLGAALMVYGYFVSNAWVSLLVGGVLTALLFYPQ